MRTRLSSALLIISAGVCAQPVFVHPDAVPSLGAYPVETRSYGVVPGLVTSGSEVVWDFSAQDFSIIGTTTDSVLLPSATPYAADFPTATHAVRLVNQFGYYRASSTGVLDLGTRLSPGSPSQINTDPAAILQFPAAVEDSWTDAVITGTTTSQLHAGTASGWGRMRLQGPVLLWPPGATAGWLFATGPTRTQACAIVNGLECGAGDGLGA